MGSLNSAVAGVAGVVYEGPWAGRPPASTLAEGARILATDIGNQGFVEFQVVGGAYRLCAATVLYLMETQIAGVNTLATEQVLFTTPGLQRSVLASLRYYSVAWSSARTEPSIH